MPSAAAQFVEVNDSAGVLTRKPCTKNIEAKIAICRDGSKTSVVVPANEFSAKEEPMCEGVLTGRLES